MGLSKGQNSLTTEQVDKLRQGIWCIYKRTGSLSFVPKLFEESFSSKIPQARGEIAEVVLEIAINEFMKTNKNIICIKNLVLPTLKKRTTEIDVVVASSKRIVLFESKSYDGKKTLVDEGKMLYKKYAVDVFGQHKHHIEKMSEIFNQARLQGVEGGYAMALFSFAKGDIQDKRDDKWKNLFPLVTTDNIVKYLEDTLTEGEDKWDIVKLKKGFQYLDEKRDNLLKSHLSRVR